MEVWHDRKLKCCASIGDILLIGEQLRILMHTDNPHLIKDRRYLLRNHSCCFIGNDTVDWLVKSGQAPDRDTAVYLMNILVDNNVFHHVNDDASFKDEVQYYRFRKDDGTFPWHEDVAIFLRGQKMYNRLVAEKKASVMCCNELNGKSYPNSFFGNQLINWLVSTKEFADKVEALKEGRCFLQNDIIRHVTDSHHFKDEELLYEFKLNYNRRFDLLDLIRPPSSKDLNALLESPQMKRSSRSPTPIGEKQGLNIPRRSLTERAESGYHSSHGDDSSLSNGESPPPFTFDSPDSIDRMTNKVSSMNLNNSSYLLMRKVTVEDLEDPKSALLKRPIRISSDPVGYGFVIRGEGPVFVKTVDPMGPAAKAGLKVGHYIYSVNDEKVVNMNHRDLAHVILASDGYLRLVVVEHPDDRS